jgi:hypothetical protein
LAKLKLTIAIKLDVEIEEIEKALKASELKEKVIYKKCFLGFPKFHIEKYYHNCFTHLN